MVAKVFSHLWGLRPVKSFTVQIGTAVVTELLKPNASVIPGRVRLPVAGLRKSPERAQAISDELLALDGVYTVAPNEVTGNVLVEFDPGRLNEADLRHIIEHEALGLLPLYSQHPAGEPARAIDVQLAQAEP